MAAEKPAEGDDRRRDDYAKKKESSRRRFAEISQQGRDIGRIPPPADPARRLSANRDFRFFCETYYPETFGLAWSADHLKVMRMIEQAVLEGGLFALAMPRGSGKTTLCECACQWAVVNGHRDFVCLIGSDEGHAVGMLDAIKAEGEENELLLADYPEVFAPIVALDGIANRCAGQLHQGERTRIGWTQREVVFPTINLDYWRATPALVDFVRPDGFSLASGSIIKVAGITGRIRGMKHKLADGRSIRPSLVVVDDPQTDESARSMTQSANREAVLSGAVLGLAGPGVKISGIMPCTVIRPGDMADSILDREKHPEWNGERTKMVYAFPTNEALWEKYAKLRNDGLRDGDGGRKATEFYRANREQMDEGSAVAWEERHNPDELSAIQHAMNLRLRDEPAFFAEYQNEPIPSDRLDEDALDADSIAAKLSQVDVRRVPADCTRLTAFVDVQKRMLYYVVAAWNDEFTGAVIDYGTWPDQQAPYFSLREARRTIADAMKSHRKTLFGHEEPASLEAQLLHALRACTETMLGAEYKREDGTLLRVERCLIDAGWGDSTAIVHQFARESEFAPVIFPSYGRPVGASHQPFSEYDPKPGERTGLNWRIPIPKAGRPGRYVLYDANFWKSFVMARLATVRGDPGCLTLWGRDAGRHRLFADHLTAEYRVKTTGRGREVDEWKLRPDRPDNHWFDCLVGAAVAASVAGSSFRPVERARKSRDRIKLSDLQAEKRRNRRPRR